MMPALVNKVKHYNKNFPILEEYGVRPSSTRRCAARCG